MERIYFLVPDDSVAGDVVKDLESLHISEQDIAVIARDDRQLEGLPQADPLEKTDIVPGAKRGAIVGTAAGLVAGLSAAAIPGAGIVIGGGAVLGITVAGTAFGAWVSALVGGSVPNSEIDQFEEAIKDGQLLMIINTPANKVARIQDRVLAHHPEAEFAGSESAIPSLV